MKGALKLSSALVAVSMLGAGGSAAWAQDGASETDGVGLDDIVVTATRRSEAANKIPLAIRALGGESLSELNVTKLDKMIEYLPNVRTASRGPGASSIYIRGLSTDTVGLQVAGTVGAQPAVALYVNDAPASLVGHNLDLYAVDLNRVEVLAGPQGTLFGASAMGGAVRYITNKPDLNEFHVGVNAGYSFTRGGEDNQNADAFINIPIIKDKVALRLVAYGDMQGGYIDNVPATFQMPFDAHAGQAGQLPTGNPLLVMRAIQSCQLSPNFVGAYRACGTGGGLGVYYYTAPTRVTINNDDFVEDNYNDASYAGFRAALTIKLNDDWSIDLMQVHQKLKTEGVFDFEPGVGDLKVTKFGENNMRNDTDISTWTLNGRLGMLDLIYTGSYMLHKTVQNADYAGYSNIGLYMPYYECDRGVYYTYDAATRGNKCYAPFKSYQTRNKTLRYTHELRVTTPVENRLRGTLGLFYDVNKLYDDTDWHYLSSDAGFIYPRAPDPSTNPYDPSVRPVKTGFLNDIQRRDRQFAIYGEASFDIVPEKLIATGGFRYYNDQASQNGSSQGSFCSNARGIYNVGTGTYTAGVNPGYYLCNTRNLNITLAGISPATYKGTLWKGNLTYKFGAGSLVYATYSEGFRPGGFNRKGCNNVCPPGAALSFYEPDKVRNYEIGGKFSLFDRRLQVNLSAYQIDWKSVQMSVFDQNISNQTFTNNFIDARIKGVEGDIAWRATPNLTFNGAFSYNDSKITKILNPFATTVLPVGSPMALSPKFQFNVRMRYERELENGLRPYFQASFQHVGSSISSDFSNVDIKYQGFNPVLHYAASTPVYYNGVLVSPGDVIKPLPDSQPLASYNMLNAAMGVKKDEWTVEVFFDNLTDERPELYKSANDGELRTTTSRPRTIGMRFSYHM